MIGGTIRATLLAGLTAAVAMHSAVATAAPQPSASTGTWAGHPAALCAQQLDTSLGALDRTAVSASNVDELTTSATANLTCLERATAQSPADVRPALARVTVEARASIVADGAARAVRRAGAVAALRAVAASATIEATRSGDTAAARAWLTLRERRDSTRIGVPDAPAAQAIAALERDRIEPAAAAAAVREDLLGTAMVVLQSRLDRIERRADDSLDESAAIAAAQVSAAWTLFDSAWRAQHPASPELAAVAAAGLAAAATAPRPTGDVLTMRADAFDEVVGTFTPVAAASDDVAAEAAAKVARFTELVSVEYGRGVRDGAVSMQLEIQEARSFMRGALDAWSTLEPVATQRSDARADDVAASLEALDDLVVRAETTPGDVADPSTVEDAVGDVDRALERAVPTDWLEGSDEADLELVSAALARVGRSAAAGDWTTAERARVEAYGAFEFGPELRLRAIDPGLALEVEGRIWYGADGDHGLASLIAAREDEPKFTAAITQLDRRLDVVNERLDESATPGAIRTNSAIIVLREGMEAVLILAALTAGLRGAASRRWRRPILIGGLLALFATVITFILADALLSSLARFGEQLEVVVSLVAIGVLLLILNWFVHKAYWTGWMAGFQKKKVAITGTARERREAEADATAMRRTSAVAQVGGLITLGFTSIYREGFETVLFLQSLVLDAGTLPVIEGAALGLVGVAGLGFLTVVLQRKLPYRRMLIVTGVLIAVVLAAMVGGTTQSMQAIGWLGVHPIAGLEVPVWMTTWLGVHPTWEAVIGQFASIVFVIGSYVVAEWWTERARAKRASARRVEHVDPPTPIEIVDREVVRT